MRVVADPHCPLHGEPKLTLNLIGVTSGRLSSKDQKIHAIDCDMDEDCTCGEGAMSEVPQEG